MAQAFAGWIDDDPDWERLAPGPVLDGLLPLASPAGRDHEDAARRAKRRDHGRRQPDAARCSCRTPGSTIASRSACRSATCGRSPATWSGPGRCCGKRRRRDVPARPRRCAVPRVDRGAARLVRREPRDGRRAVARLPPQGDRATDASTWSRGGRRGALRRLDRQRALLTSTMSDQPSGSRRAGKGSAWSAINVRKVAELTERGRMRPAGLAAYEARDPSGRPSTRTNATQPRLPMRRRQGSARTQLPGRTGSAARRPIGARSRIGSRAPRDRRPGLAGWMP